MNGAEMKDLFLEQMHQAPYVSYIAHPGLLNLPILFLPLSYYNPLWQRNGKTLIFLLSLEREQMSLGE